MAVTPYLLFITSTVTIGFLKAIPLDCTVDNHTSTPFFIGSVPAEFDPNLNTDAIYVICEDFANTSELALRTSNGIAHATYDPLYDLVYWAAWDDNSVYRGLADRNHTNENPCFQEVVLNNIDNGVVDVDVVNQRLYWGSNVDGVIGVVDMNGDDSVVLFDIKSGAENVWDIRVDATVGTIFWGASTSNGRIAKGPITGGNHSVLHSFVKVECIDLNPDTETIYWLTFLTQGSNPATLQSAKYDGSGLQDFTTINVNLATPDMVLYNGYFYVTTMNLNSGNGELEMQVFQIPEVKGGIAVPLEIVMPLRYLFVEPNVIAPIDTNILLAKSYSGFEGDTVTIQISRTGNLFRCTTIGVSTLKGTAEPGEDYEPFSVTLQFEPYQSVAEFALRLLDNDNISPNQVQMYFYIIVSHIDEEEFIETEMNSTVIIEDNEDLIYNLGYVTNIINESDSFVVITIDRSWNGTISEDTQITLVTYSGTATDEEDFMAVNQTVVFPSSSNNQTVEVNILQDDDYEMDEIFSVVISNPSHGTLGDPVSATISIQDVCPLNYCKNGGKCSRNEDQGKFVCKCDTFHTGQTCNEFSSGVIWGMGSAILVFIVLLIVFLIIFVG